MDIVLLKTLVNIEQAGSFSKAARVMGCVQSNVTARIRRLEENYKQTIFHRGRGGASLTPFGQRLHRHAIAILDHIDIAERDLKDLSNGSAPLRLGSKETVAALHLPGLLKRLKQEVPKSPITIKTGPSADLLGSLIDRSIDAAFVSGPVDPDRFESALAFEEQLVSIQMHEGPPMGPMLAFRKGCSYRAIAESWLQTIGKLDMEVTEMGTLEGILGCVSAGMGFAVAPRQAVWTYREAESFTLVPLPDPWYRVHTVLAWRRDHQRSLAHNALIGMLKNQASTQAEQR